MLVTLVVIFAAATAVVVAAIWFHPFFSPNRKIGIVATVLQVGKKSKKFREGGDRKHMYIAHIYGAIGMVINMTFLVS